MEQLSFKLEAYEGPLDLLLSLITKNKIDIYDIPIAVILDQYLAYLEEMRRLDMDIAGEFITMAAELMLIKSKMMLPKSVLENEEDPRARLAAALVEYKRAKEAAGLLAGNYEIYAGRLAKPADESPYESIPELKNQDAALLEEAFVRIMERSKKLKSMLSTPEQTLENLLKRRVTPIPEKIFGIMRLLYRSGDTSFEEILLSSRSRSDIIASFVAVLELLKVRRVSIYLSGEDLILHLEKENRTDEH